MKLRRRTVEPPPQAPSAPPAAHEELRETFTTEMDLHLTAVSSGTRAVLPELLQHEWFPGSTDPGGIAIGRAFCIDRRRVS